jgi:large subunit ribosomal protein L15
MAEVRENDRCGAQGAPPAPGPGAKTAKTRVGRGEGSKGKTAGRGTKGTKARYQVPEAFEGGQMPLHMRLPKLRGFKNPFRTTYQVVNLDRLSALYPKGGEVTVDDLVAKGAVRDGHLVKVLGTGEITVAVNVTATRSPRGQGEDRGRGGSVTEPDPTARTACRPGMPVPHHEARTPSPGRPGAGVLSS